MLPREVQVAPFLQGWSLQWSFSVQCRPVQPRGQAQVKVCREERWQVPPLLQGEELQALSTGVSHKELVKPRGQVQVKEGTLPWYWFTTQLPPF